MAHLPQTAIEKAARKASFERRATAFLDILGWRDKVSSASADPTKLAAMYQIVRIFTEIGKGLRAVDKVGVNHSSFSDHMVFTAPVDENLPMFLTRVGVFQLSAARLGFFIRGAVTIGDMVHDEHIVFGPALVKAYDLEQSAAVYPRIVIDEEVTGALEFDLSYVVTEEGVTFLDPFSQNFFRINQRIEADLASDVPMMRNKALQSVDPLKYIGSLLPICRAELLAAKRQRDWEKIAWLYDRVAKDVGATARAAIFSKRW